ncbi:MAG: hypothetical protein VCD50_11380 [Alphaproteobacteria bacterium]
MVKRRDLRQLPAVQAVWDSLANSGAEYQPDQIFYFLKSVIKADGYGEDAPQTVQLVHSLVAAQALRGGLIGRGLRVGPSIAA